MFLVLGESRSAAGRARARAGRRGVLEGSRRALEVYGPGLRNSLRISPEPLTRSRPPVRPLSASGAFRDRLPSEGGERAAEAKLVFRAIPLPSSPREAPRIPPETFGPKSLPLRDLRPQVGATLGIRWTPAPYEAITGAAREERLLPAPAPNPLKP